MTTLKFPSQVGEDEIVPIITEEQKSRLEWQKFIDETYGSLADENLQRPQQGNYEVREIIE
ncbi:hypothetical protein [Okeania sp. SIO2B3]|uniref:hypothetical protein n=1 Tax=Okeania sp. SIO2B3 TaxID=2607784 RepID=UPI0013C05074|nr:hypothetical protein [Okeania sp. SIO2B3]NET45090.1 hypothetical protein [Okeania sp. SIO2B3]